MSSSTSATSCARARGVPTQRLSDVEFVTSFPGFQLTQRPNQLRALSNLHSSQSPRPETNYTGSNISRYSNPEFDSLATTYLAAADLGAQRKATKRMAGILLRDTPVITDYFINYVTASSSKVKNYVPEGLSHIRLAKVSLA